MAVTGMEVKGSRMTVRGQIIGWSIHMNIRPLPDSSHFEFLSWDSFLSQGLHGIGISYNSNLQSVA